MLTGLSEVFRIISNVNLFLKGSNLFIPWHIRKPMSPLELYLLVSEYLYFSHFFLVCSFATFFEILSMLHLFSGIYNRAQFICFSFLFSCVFLCQHALIQLQKVCHILSSLALIFCFLMHLQGFCVVCLLILIKYCPKFYFFFISQFQFSIKCSAFLFLFLHFAIGSCPSVRYFGGMRTGFAKLRCFQVLHLNLFF